MFDRQGTYLSANGINQISYYVWLPEHSKVNGILQLVHGMLEHSGLYDEFARFMTKNGFIVCQNDILGHGNSAEKDGFGYMSDNDGDVHLIDDIYKLTEIIKEEYPKEPLFLLGHSMGSFIARVYCVQYPNALTGVLFSGTANGSISKIGLPLVSLLVKIKGGKSSGAIINRLSQKAFNQKFKPANNGYEWLSRDKNFLNVFAEDKLCQFSFTLGGYKTLLTLMQKMSKKTWFQNYPKMLPTYLFSGLDDPIGEFGRGVIETYEKLISAGNEKIDIKLYEECRHVLLNELNKDEVYVDILEWILKVLDNK